MADCQTGLEGYKMNLEYLIMLENKELLKKQKYIDKPVDNIMWFPGIGKKDTR